MCFVFIKNRFLHQKFSLVYGVILPAYALVLLLELWMISWNHGFFRPPKLRVGATKDQNVLCSPKFFGPFRLSFATNPASPMAGLVSLLKAFNHYLSTGFTNQSKACNSDRLTAVFVFVASSFLVFYNAYLAKAWDRVRWWIFQMNRTSHVTFCYVPRTTGNEAAVCMVTQRLIENNSIRRYK